MSKRRLTTEAVIFNAAGQVLLVRPGRSPGEWELPGGKVKKRESLPDAIVREVREETGLSVRPLALIGVFHIRDENTHDFVFTCRLMGSRSRPRPKPPEIIECGFFPVESRPEPTRPFTLERIRDALAGVAQPLPIELTSGQWLG